MAMSLSPLMLGGGVFLAGALAAYMLDSALTTLLQQTWAIILIGGVSAVGAYLILQQSLLPSLLPAIKV